MEKLEVTFSFVPTPTVGEPGEVCIRLSPANIELLRELVKQNPEMRERARVQFRPYNIVEQARKFFFVVVDRIIKKQSGMASREERELMKEQLKAEFGAKDEKGKLKSLSEKAKEPYSRRELWDLTEGAIQWAEEAGADIQDMLPDYYEMRREM